MQSRRKGWYQDSSSSLLTDTTCETCLLPMFFGRLGITYVASKALLLHQRSLHLHCFCSITLSQALTPAEWTQGRASQAAISFKSGWNSACSVHWPSMQEKPHKACPRKMPFQQQVEGGKTDQTRQPHIPRPLDPSSKEMKFNRIQTGEGRVIKTQERTLSHCTSNSFRLLLKHKHLSVVHPPHRQKQRYVHKPGWRELSEIRIFFLKEY